MLRGKGSNSSIVWYKYTQWWASSDLLSALGHVRQVGQVGQDAGPEVDVTEPHLLFHVVLVHAGVDLQVLVSGAGEPGPSDRDAQRASARVSVDERQRVKRGFVFSGRFLCMFGEPDPVRAKLVQ